MSLPADPVLIALSAATAGIGALGGIGGAILLVPTLVLLGVEPSTAAPLGLLSVAAGSLAAGPQQLSSGTVHHRLGVTLEVVASTAAIIGAMASPHVSDRALRLVLAGAAAASALSGIRVRSIRNLPDPSFAEELPGEWPGTLAGAYLLDGEVVPYRAKRLGSGLASMVAAGLVSGLAGASGGFIKTPAMNLIMGVPVKVAAATTTFTVGITAAAGLAVFAGQGRILPLASAAVVLGGLLGGRAGTMVQERLAPGGVRRALSLVLLVIAALLVVIR